MNFVHLYKLCNKSVAKNSAAHDHVIRPFIKKPTTTLCNKRQFATRLSNEDFVGKNSIEDPPMYGPSESRVPPDLVDKINMETVFKKLDIILDELEDQAGGLRVPYTVDLRDKIHVNQVLDMGRHCRVTASGRVFSYSALVVLGTGDGTAGVGYGKSDKPMDAVAKAQTDAQKRMISVSRWHQTIPHTIISRYRGTKVVMKAGRPGTGVSGHPTLQIVADAFGLEDITCKTYKSRNTRKIVAAFVHAIIKNAHLHPASKARMLGRKFVSWEEYWKPPPPVPKRVVRKDWTTTSEPTPTERQEAIQTISTVPGFDLYSFAREYGIDLEYTDVTFGKSQVVDTEADDSEELEQILRKNKKGAKEDVEAEEEAVDEEHDEYEEYVPSADELPDFPRFVPELPLQSKTLEERISRETKVMPVDDK